MCVGGGGERGGVCGAAGTTPSSPRRCGHACALRPRYGGPLGSGPLPHHHCPRGTWVTTLMWTPGQMSGTQCGAKTPEEDGTSGKRTQEPKGGHVKVSALNGAGTGGHSSSARVSECKTRGGGGVVRSTAHDCIWKGQPQGPRLGAVSACTPRHAPRPALGASSPQRCGHRTGRWRTQDWGRCHADAR